MKHNFIIFISFCGASLIFTACNNPNSSSVATDNPNVSAVITLPTLTFAKKEVVKAEKGQTANIILEIAQGNSPQAKFVNETIFKALGGSKENAQKGNLDYQALVNYFVSTALTYKTDPNDESGGDWSSDYTVSVGYNSANFVSFTVSGWEYSGGAHGGGGISAYNLDLSNLKSLSQADLIGDEIGLRKLLTPLLDKKIKEGGEFSTDDLDNFKENGLIKLPATISFSTTAMSFDFTYQELFNAGDGDAMSAEIEISLSQAQPFLKIKL
jgi:Deacetylase PdaC